MKFKSLVMIILVFSTLLIAGCSNDLEAEGKDSDFPPSMSGVIQVNGTDYEMKAGGYRWERKKGLQTEVIQTDHASPYQMAENIKSVTVQPDQKAEIKIEESPEITVYLWNSNGREKEITHDANQIMVPSSTGTYIYEALAKWKNGEISYTFVLEVQ